MILLRRTLLNAPRLTSTTLTTRTINRQSIVRALATMATDPTKYKLNHSMYVHVRLFYSSLLTAQDPGQGPQTLGGLL